jgi:NAD(P)-dependent dehydrogenase (short-subunit alcohol dehydrogenase family)
MIEAEVKTQMNPIYDFNGQVALVTGAAKGMGLATALMFAQSGASTDGRSVPEPDQRRCAQSDEPHRPQSQ